MFNQFQVAIIWDENSTFIFINYELLEAPQDCKTENYALVSIFIEIMLERNESRGIINHGNYSQFYRGESFQGRNKYLLQRRIFSCVHTVGDSNRDNRGCRDGYHNKCLVEPNEDLVRSGVGRG